MLYKFLFSCTAIMLRRKFKQALHYSSTTLISCFSCFNCLILLPNYFSFSFFYEFIPPFKFSFHIFIITRSHYGMVIFSIPFFSIIHDREDHYMSYSLYIFFCNHFNRTVCVISPQWYCLRFRSKYVRPRWPTLELNWMYDTCRSSPSKIHTLNFWRSSTPS